MPPGFAINMEDGLDFGWRISRSHQIHDPLDNDGHFKKSDAFGYKSLKRDLLRGIEDRPHMAALPHGATGQTQRRKPHFVR